MPAHRKFSKAPSMLLFLVLAVSALLNSLFAGRSGFGYEYYSAAVFSMSKSASNFLYASFDPMGFVSVEQGPLGLMLQTVFANFLGYGAWAICLPQILSGVLSCFVLYGIIKSSCYDEYTGSWAALFGAFALAVTPVFVAVSRSNMPDSVLILFLLLSCRALLSGAKRGNVWLVLLAGALLGLAYNVKMNQALFVLSGLLILCFLIPKLSGAKRVVWITLFLSVFAVFSAGWMALVDTTPAAERPYIGGTAKNSAFERIVSGSPFGLEDESPTVEYTGASVDLGGAQGLTDGVNSVFGRDVYMAGNSWLTRLFSGIWYGQASWLLPFAVISLVISLIYILSTGDDLLGRMMVVSSAWLITGFFALSFSGSQLSSYYLAMMAPPIALCSAGGVYAMVKVYRESGVLWLLFPVVLICCAAEQAAAIVWYGWALWTLCFPAACVLFSLLLFIARLIPHSGERKCPPCAGAACLMLLGASVVWSLTPILYGGTDLPQAGPQLQNVQRETVQLPQGLKEYIEQNHAESSVMLVAPSADEYGSFLIAEKGWYVIAAGGREGSDPCLTLARLQQLSQEKKVRFMLVTQPDQTKEYTAWVLTRKMVPAEDWFTGMPGTAGLPSLYDLWSEGVAAQP